MVDGGWGRCFGGSADANFWSVEEPDSSPLTHLNPPDYLHQTITRLRSACHSRSVFRHLSSSYS